MSEQSQSPEPTTPELVWGKELSATIGTLVGNTLMRSGLSLDAPYSKAVFTIYRESGYDELVIEPVRGRGDNFEYSKGARSSNEYEGRLSGGVNYRGEVNMYGFGDFERHALTLESFISEVEKFEGSSTEITFKVPSV